jgi:hypothetical protein
MTRESQCPISLRSEHPPTFRKRVRKVKIREVKQGDKSDVK